LQIAIIGFVDTFSYSFFRVIFFAFSRLAGLLLSPQRL